MNKNEGLIEAAPRIFLYILVYKSPGNALSSTYVLNKSFSIIRFDPSTHRNGGRSNCNSKRIK